MAEVGLILFAGTGFLITVLVLVTAVLIVGDVRSRRGMTRWR